MSRVKTATILALVTGTILSALAPAPASAITLLDFIRGGKKQQSIDPPRGLPGVDAGQSEAPRAAKPLPKISGPRYYAYKADPMRRIAADTILLDRQVTGSVASDMSVTTGVASTSSAGTALSSPDISAPAEIADAIEARYKSDPQLIWIDEAGPTARATAALSVLAAAADVGLDPADYTVALPPANGLSGDAEADQRAQLAFELRLSAAALTYISDTVRGRIDPNRISGYHDFARKPMNFEAMLRMMSLSGDVAAFLESRTPASAHFVALRQELHRLRAQTDTAPRIEIAAGTLLKPGQSNPELANIVAAVAARGSDALKMTHSLTLANYRSTPDYTPELVAMIEDFQKENGLKPDGIVGKASIRIMTGGDTTADQVRKVEIAMEQARWLPADLGQRYVFINQPQYMVHYVEGGREQFSMRVVVGSKANQTYFFQDEIQTVEFNPYWGVPQSIIVNEMLPHLRQDPYYLDRQGYQVEVNGTPVSSASVDWYGSTRSIAVRQPPSSDNALGELKILFPNSHAIYMHDTPSKSFFSRDMRALSHGCVRLADPRRMAAAVLGVTVDDVAREIAGGANKGVSVPEKIPVYVSYFTAWPNKEGVVEYFDDVYERDTYVQRAIEATRAARSAAG